MIYIDKPFFFQIPNFFKKLLKGLLKKIIKKIISSQNFYKIKWKM